MAKSKKKKELGWWGRAVENLARSRRKLSWSIDPSKRVAALEDAIRHERWGEAREALDAGPLPPNPRMATIAWAALFDSPPRDVLERTLEQCLARGNLSAKEASKIFGDAAEIGDKKFKLVAKALRDADGVFWPAQEGDGMLEAFCSLERRHWEPKGARRVLGVANFDLWRADPEKLSRAAEIAYQHDDARVALAFAQAFPEMKDVDLDGETTLTSAAQKRHASALVELLVRQGADVKKVDHMDFTPLMRSAFAGDLRGVEVLLAHSDASTTTGEGATAWSFAVCQGFVKIAEALERAGAPSMAQADAALEMLVEQSPDNWREALGLCLPRASPKGVAAAAASAGRRGQGELLRELLPSLDPALAFEAALRELDRSQSSEMAELARAWALSWRERQELAQMRVAVAGCKSSRARL